MKERIKELLNQAGIYQPDRFDAIDGSNQMEKFAELIVQECAQICQDQPNHYALKTDRDNCAVAIKEHFGVEE